LSTKTCKKTGNENVKVECVDIRFETRTKTFMSITEGKNHNPTVTIYIVRTCSQIAYTTRRDCRPKCLQNYRVNFRLLQP